MAGEAAAGDAVGAVVLGEVPEDDGLVARGSYDHVGVVDWGGDGRYGVRVGAHRAAEDQNLCHCCLFLWLCFCFVLFGFLCRVWRKREVE